MKSALPTTAQPALQKRRFSTDEEDSDDESAIVRPEDLVESLDDLFLLHLCRAGDDGKVVDSTTDSPLPEPG